MKVKLCLLVLVLSQTLFQIETRPGSESTITDSLRARLGDTLSEIEWLLDQLVNILSDMVNGIEQDSSLLQNYHFRQILIQVIKRIDFILEHFENVGTTVLTSAVIYELQRIDCVRIRLANYISQTRKFDDSHCRVSSGSKKPSPQPPNTEQILPLLTQIVQILVKVSQQLDHIASLKEPFPTGKRILKVVRTIESYRTNFHHHNIGSTVTSPPPPLWTKPASTINWEDLISKFISSKPGTVPNVSLH